MDCKEAEGLSIPYLLGELGPAETERVSGHAATCSGCMSRMGAEGELLVRLSSMEPVPQRVKEKLLSRVEADVVEVGKLGWMGRLSALGRNLAAQGAPTVAATMLAFVVVGGVWYSGRAGGATSAMDALTTPTASPAGPDVGAAPALIELVDHQLLDPLGLHPSVSAGLLEGIGTDARGVVLASPSGNGAFFVVSQMPRLPADKVYQVWLTGDGGTYSAGTFYVDPAGYGQARLRLAASLSDLESIVVTVERSGGSAGPTGRRVLSGGLQ